jgi:hypothetical protein
MISLLINPKKAIANRSASVPEEELGSWGIIAMERSPACCLEYRKRSDIGLLTVD